MLRVEHLSVAFGGVTVVDDVSLEVPAGPHGVGLVGESGSGKTTIARAILRLTPASSGDIRLDDVDVAAADRRTLARLRRRLQVVLQDPDGTLDPRQRVGSALAEVLTTHRVVDAATLDERVSELLGEVGLDPEVVRRLPHQLSGGQRQRVAIARALALEPEVVILDEPTSALDVSVQAQVLALIESLRERRRLSYLLISHNLAIVERLCEDVVVLYLGRVVEQGPTREVLARPLHPYTAALRSAVPDIVPRPEGTRIALSGTPASSAHLPSGCAFHPRCPAATDLCARERPMLREVEAGRWVACHRAEEMARGTLTLTGQLRDDELEES